MCIRDSAIKTSSNATGEPSGEDIRSTLIESPAVTLYCWHPFLIIAYISLPLKPMILTCIQHLINTFIDNI